MWVSTVSTLCTLLALKAADGFSKQNFKQETDQPLNSLPEVNAEKRQWFGYPGGWGNQWDPGQKTDSKDKEQGFIPIPIFIFNIGNQANAGRLNSLLCTNCPEQRAWGAVKQTTLNRAD